MTGVTGVAGMAGDVPGGDARVRAAHADAWQEHGRLRRRDGGDRAALPGVLLMSSGLPYTQWNTADVLDAEAVDVAAVQAWYAARALPWGVRVAAGTPWPHGRRVVTQRLMAQSAADHRPAPDVPGVEIRAAGPGDLEAVVAVDAAAFEADPGPSGAWLGPLLDDAAVAVVLAQDGSGPVATAYTVRSDGLAGPAVLLGGVAVVPRARRRGIASAVSSVLLRDAYAGGARLGHLQPDDDAAAAVYRGLGFVPAGGLDVYVDVDVPPARA